jgi:hypothetical protein
VAYIAHCLLAHLLATTNIAKLVGASCVYIFIYIYIYIYRSAPFGATGSPAVHILGGGVYLFAVMISIRFCSRLVPAILQLAGAMGS